MAGRVTIQDIADALGLSRNTVSKAINNTGVLADATREKILLKAVEMGYKQFSYVNINEAGNASLSISGETRDTDGSVNPSEETVQTEKGPKVISLLTANVFDSSHFASLMLDKFQRELSQLGYSFMIHHVTKEHLLAKTLPSSVNTEITAGFLCIELFDMTYAEYVCSLGIPTLFVDAPADSLKKKLNSDILIMDNRTNVISFVQDMVKQGYKRFGYIGDIRHCRSFCERYLAMQEGLMIAGLPYNDNFSICDSPDESMYNSQDLHRSFLEQSLRSMKQLPDVFLCANDFVAIDVMAVFSKLGLSVPEDVLLCGFDDSPESRVLTPTLTSIHIHTQIMGFSAVHLLLSRINNPEINFRTTETETTMVYRFSTNRSK